MKKIFLILTFCILVVFGYGQTRSSTSGFIPRSNQTIVVEDGDLSARNSLFTPRFTDTTQAATYILKDTLGNVIYLYSTQSLWVRTIASGSTKKWTEIGSGGGGGSGTVTNIATGLGLSGGPITATGTLLVDTASASILSRQRAANTYQPIGDYLTTDSWYNIVRDGGADSTGSTDVSSIIQNAINAGWKTIFIPHGTFLVSTQIDMLDSITIMGAGRFASRIKLETDISAFHCSVSLGGNNATFSNFGFYGDYATGGLTTQRGIAIDSATAILITNISGVNMGGFVVNILNNANCCTNYIVKAGKSNTITDSYFEANYGGVNFGLRAEYNLIANSTFTQNLYAIQNLAGNSRINGNTLVNNTYGLYMTSSANGGHGVATDNTFNHNGTNLYMSGITIGFSFTNNTFVQNNLATAGVIELISCANVFFYGGFLSNDTIRTTLCTTISFDNVNPYLVALNPVFVVVSGSAPTVTYAGRVQNSMTIRDVVNSKELDITYLNNKTNFTGTTGNTFGFLNAAADSTVDITGSLRATTGVRFSGLPTAAGTKAVRIDANGTLSIADTTTGGGIPGIDDVLAEAQVLTADRTIELNGNKLSVKSGGNDWLDIDPVTGLNHLHSFYSGGGDTGEAEFHAGTTFEGSTAKIYSFFNATEASVAAVTDGVTSAVTYEADTHTFTGDIILNSLTTGATTDSVMVWNATTKQVGYLSASIFGGTNTFVGLSDGPGSFTGQAGKGVRVNAGETALEYFSISGSGTVTSVGFTGGLISVANPTTTPAFTVAGTSGGIPYFSSASAWASSAALAANALVIGGGAGAAPATTTTGTGILTFLGTPSSANLKSAVTDETGTGGALVFATAPSMSSITLAAGTASAGTAPMYYTAGTNLTASVSGAVEFDGTTFYNNTASGRGFNPSTMISILRSDFTQSNVNTVQPVFGTTQDVWTLQGSTTYYFEGQYYFNHSATSHSVGMSFELGGGASVTAISYGVISWNGTVNTVVTGQGSVWITTVANTAINQSAANASEYVKFSGIISMNAGGTVTPSITYSVDPGGTILAKTGTYISFTPIGTNTFTTIGNVQ